MSPRGKRSGLRAATGLLLCAAWLPAQDTTANRGQIKGSLLDSKGARLANAAVVVGRLPVQGQATMPFVVQTETAADGGFQLVGLPEGKYHVCAYVPGSDLINPCAWSLTPPSALVTASQTTTVAPIVLARGRRVDVRIEDTGGLLEAHEGKTTGAHLLLGVWWGNGLYAPLHVKSKDSRGRNYEILIPVNVPLQLSIQSSFFSVGDANGKALAKGSATNIPILLSEADTGKSQTFTVLGRN